MPSSGAKKRRYKRRQVKNENRKEFIRKKHETHHLIRGRWYPKVETLLEMYPGAILIKNWDHLKEVNPQSNTHILEVDEYSGHINCINGERIDEDYEKQIPHLGHYLSTHTFYGLNYVTSTKIMQLCGFNVVIDNWDKNTCERSTY